MDKKDINSRFPSKRHPVQIAHGKLVGKVGGVFTSSGMIGGGNETTIMSILQGLLIHGMIVQGVQEGNHYGPV